MPDPLFVAAPEPPLDKTDGLGVWRMWVYGLAPYEYSGIVLLPHLFCGLYRNYRLYPGEPRFIPWGYTKNYLVLEDGTVYFGPSDPHRFINAPYTTVPVNSGGTADVIFGWLYMSTSGIDASFGLINGFIDKDYNYCRYGHPSPPPPPEWDCNEPPFEPVLYSIPGKVSVIDPTGSIYYQGSPNGSGIIGTTYFNANGTTDSFNYPVHWIPVFNDQHKVSDYNKLRIQTAAHRESPGFNYVRPPVVTTPTFPLGTPGTVAPSGATWTEFDDSTNMPDLVVVLNDDSTRDVTVYANPHDGGPAYMINSMEVPAIARYKLYRLISENKYFRTTTDNITTYTEGVYYTPGTNTLITASFPWDVLQDANWLCQPTPRILSTVQMHRVPLYEEDLYIVQEGYPCGETFADKTVYYKEYNDGSGHGVAIAIPTNLPDINRVFDAHLSAEFPYRDPVGGDSDDPARNPPMLHHSLLGNGVGMSIKVVSNISTPPPDRHFNDYRPIFHINVSDNAPGNPFPIQVFRWYNPEDDPQQQWITHSSFSHKNNVSTIDECIPIYPLARKGLCWPIENDVDSTIRYWVYDATDGAGNAYRKLVMGIPGNLSGLTNSQPNDQYRLYQVSSTNDDDETFADSTATYMDSIVDVRVVTKDTPMDRHVTPGELYISIHHSYNWATLHFNGEDDDRERYMGVSTVPSCVPVPMTMLDGLQCGQVRGNNQDWLVYTMRAGVVYVEVPTRLPRSPDLHQAKFYKYDNPAMVDAVKQIILGQADPITGIISINMHVAFYVHDTFDMAPPEGEYADPTFISHRYYTHLDLYASDGVRYKFDPIDRIPCCGEAEVIQVIERIANDNDNQASSSRSVRGDGYRAIPTYNSDYDDTVWTNSVELLYPVNQFPEELVIRLKELNGDRPYGIKIQYSDDTTTGVDGTWVDSNIQPTANLDDAYTTGGLTLTGFKDVD